MNGAGHLGSFLTFGNFVIIDLVAATTNAFNGGLLAQRPDYYRGRQWTMVGILLLAVFGGIGGGVTRDIILGEVPGALTNPWYLILCILAGGIAMLLSYQHGQQFRETLYQFATAFSLPWYAAIGVNAGLTAGLPAIACVLIGVIGPTAGRFLIDITAGHAAKQFVRGEWFVGTAVLVSVVYLVLEKYAGLSIWPATLISVAIGFTFRVAALWFAWEEPMPRVPKEVVGELPKRDSLKEKMKPGWHPKYD